MALINREQALSHPFANGHYDKKHADEHFIMGFEDYKEWLEDLPTVEAIPIPKNATNGDIIKALFPEVFVTNCKLVDKVGYFNFDADWWNSPYKENKDGNVD